MENKIEKYYDGQGTANHYDSHRINNLWMMERIWGTRAIMMHYEMSVFEYKYRLGQKDSDSLEQEITKIKWYEAAIQYLREKLGTPEEVEGLTGDRHPLPERLKQILNKNI